MGTATGKAAHLTAIARPSSTEEKITCLPLSARSAARKAASTKKTTKMSMTPILEWTMNIVSAAKKVASSMAPTLSLRQYQPRRAASGKRARPNNVGMILHPRGSLPNREMPTAMMNFPRGG